MQTTQENTYLALQLYNEGMRHFQGGDVVAALCAFVEAINTDPSRQDCKSAFVQVLGFVHLNQFDPAIKSAIELCLADKSLDHRFIAAGWLMTVKNDPDTAGLWQTGVIEKGDIPPDALNGPFLLNGLKSLIPADAEVERSLTVIRRAMLLSPARNNLSQWKAFLCAMAIQCDMNEYAYYEAEDETEALESLVSEVGQEQTPSLAKIALLGCYRPLHLFKKAGTWLQAGGDHALELYHAHISERQAIEKAAKGIKTCGIISDKTSKVVGQQYEENPYPRWKSINLQSLSEAQKESSRGLTALSAGCGTGRQACMYAKALPYADITAVDLSLASVSYGKYMANEWDLQNVTFYQGDLLAIGELGQTFDYIGATGVIHHMAEPLAGLKALRDVLKPGGFIKLQLYSKIARKQITACQQWIKEQGYSADAFGIRQFRHDVLNGEKAGEFGTVIMATDFFSLSECRDLLFHVQEHCFDCMGIKELLDEADMDLLLFNSPDPQVRPQYLSMFPGDPQCLSLDNWHRFEEQHPHVFLGMYGLMVARKGERKPMMFPPWIMNGVG